MSDVHRIVTQMYCFFYNNTQFISRFFFVCFSCFVSLNHLILPHSLCFPPSVRFISVPLSHAHCVKASQLPFLKKINAGNY